MFYNAKVFLLLWTLVSFSISSANLNNTPKVPSSEIIKTIQTLTIQIEEHYNEVLIKNFNQTAFNKKYISAAQFLKIFNDELSKQINKLQLVPKKKKKKKSNKKDIEKNNNTSLKLIINQANNYINHRSQIAHQFFDILAEKGGRLPNSNKYIPSYLISGPDEESTLNAQDRADRQWGIEVEEALAPYDNCIKIVVDLLLQFIEDNPGSKYAATIHTDFILDLRVPLREEKFIVYPIKVVSLPSKPQSVHSSLNALPLNYITFIRNNNQYVIDPSGQCSSLDLFWVSKDTLSSSEHSKIYSNIKPVRNGILIALSWDSSLIYHIYKSGTPFVGFDRWASISKMPDDEGAVLSGSERLCQTYNYVLQNTVIFVEFSDISRFSDSLEIMAEEGVLSQKVFLEALQWVLEHEYEQKIDEIPEYYPVTLKRKRQTFKTEEAILELKRSNAAIRRNFKKEEKVVNIEELQSMNHAMLKSACEGRGAFGNRMLDWCIKKYIATKTNQIVGERTRGSHRQLIGAPGENSQTFASRHGRQRKHGIKKSALAKMFNLTNSD